MRTTKGSSLVALNQYKVPCGNSTPSFFPIVRVRYACGVAARRAQIAAERDRAAAALSGGAVVQLDAIGDPSVGVEHHGPGQLGDLTGAQTGFNRQQDHHAVTPRVSATPRSP
jgi:hypothetical protein